MLFSSLLLLAMAVSLDGFGIAALYGLRKIKIPLISIAIICGCSGFIIFLAMQIGAWLSLIFTPRFAESIGALLLIVIGIWALIQTTRHKEHSESKFAQSHEDVVAEEITKTEDERTDKENTVFKLEIKYLGLVIQILSKKKSADMDRSGIISPFEAVWLGIALSLDAFGAGIGAALLGFNPLLTSVFIALSSGLFVWLGLRVGFLLSHLHWIKKLSFLPGCLLIGIGFLKLF